MGSIGSKIGAGLVSPVTGLVGGITGSDKAAEAQKRAATDALNVQREQFQATRKDLRPFVQAGMGALPQLQTTMAPIDRTQAMSQYFGGPEYAMMQEQAGRGQLAAREAMGGMGATSTSNALASIAPQLAMQHLSGLESSQMDQYNRAMGLASLGQTSAVQTGTAGQQYASGAARAFREHGEAKAMKAMAPFQTVMQVGGMAAGAAAGGGF